MDVKICLNKLSLDNPTQCIVVTHNLMDELPKSKYREEGYLDMLTAEYEAPKTDKYDTDATLAYSSLDEMIPCWPLDQYQ